MEVFKIRKSLNKLENNGVNKLVESPQKHGPGASMKIYFFQWSLCDRLMLTVEVFVC